MIRKHYSLIVADNILNNLLNNIRQPTDKNILVECYNNGREQGYHLCFWEQGCPKAITFAQNRNSDDIVVYYGEYSGNYSISEDAYKNRRYFRYNKIYLIINYIFTKIDEIPVDK